MLKNFKKSFNKKARILLRDIPRGQTQIPKAIKRRILLIIIIALPFKKDCGKNFREDKAIRRENDVRSDSGY